MASILQSYSLTLQSYSLQTLLSPYSESKETLGILTSKFESAELFLFHIQDCVERQWVLSVLQCLALVCELVLSWLIKETDKKISQ